MSICDLYEPNLKDCPHDDLAARRRGERPVVAEELGGCVRQQVVEREQGDVGGDLVLVVNVLKFCKEDTSGRTLLKQVPML